jgi:hypothetical protein
MTRLGAKTRMNVAPVPSTMNSRRPVRWMLFYDGTSNTPSDGTNVWRLYRTAAAQGGEFEQRRCYWAGVGVRPWERVRGGAFGRAMSKKILEGYAWLANDHRPGDELFIFGFSRGAFTAMGLVGLLAWHGLPEQRLSEEELRRVYVDYRQATLQDFDTAADLTCSDLHPRKGFRSVRIRFIGLFDTVRAAGLEVFKWGGPRVPGEVPAEIRVRDPRTLALRYTRHLPSNVDRAFHAVAIDEHRAVFHPRVWIIPRSRPRGPEQVEQRWFAGAHANVGGGYENDGLALIPLQWIREKAVQAGATFAAPAACESTNTLSHDVRNSYREWLSGLYSRVSWREYERPIHAGGLHFTDGERSIRYESQTIDPSVFDRLRTNPSYRPSNLLAFLARWLPADAADRLALASSEPGIAAADERKC